MGGMQGRNESTKPWGRGVSRTKRLWKSRVADRANPERDRRPFQSPQRKLPGRLAPLFGRYPSSPWRSLTPSCLIYNQPIGRNKNRMRLFPMNLGQARMRLVQGGAVFATVTLIAGCGAGYRPVVTPVTPSGPAAQPSSFAVVVSAPSPTTPGVATIIGYSGD